MGLLDWFRKPKSKIPVQVREKEVSEALRKTVEKAKNHGGDPFYEYRKKNILPEEFEYGMNCFLDRIFELEGKEVAQKTYEELKMMGGSTLKEVASGGDVAGLPILLSVKNVKIGLEAHNKAVSILKKEFREKLLTDNPIFLARLEDETENEFVQRLITISLGFKDKIIYLNKNKQGKLFKSKKLSLYSELIISEILPQYNYVETNPKELETWLATGAFFGKIIPNESIELDKFLLLIGSDFWHTFWAGIFEYFCDAKPYAKPYINLIAHKNGYMEDMEEKWIKDLRNLGDWNIVWERIKNREAEECSKIHEEMMRGENRGEGYYLDTGLPTDVFLFTLVAKFLTVFGGYRGENFSKLIADADRGMLKFLCNKLVAETIEDYNRSYIQDLKDKNKDVRAEAPFIRILEDENDDVRTHARVALGEILYLLRKSYSSLERV
ncbi:MAG: hypothetical protein WA102_09785 [Candidatus Methanoperedens sp.]